MKLWIEKIILWPQTVEDKPRLLNFVPNKLNIIYGDSQTGKSAIIPIVDYCLCSSDCRIPVGVIRDSCSWFGVQLKASDEELLLARKNPGIKKATNEMYFRRGHQIELPESIDRGDVTSDEVKNELNDLLGITDLELGDTGYFDSRPSFRDEAAFLYQPQNIIANSEALFYKLDELQHKKRLSVSFPYFLGSLSERELLAKIELSELDKEIKRKTREFGALSNLSIRWRLQIKSELAKAVELGLSTYKFEHDENIEDQITEIERITRLNSSDAQVSEERLESASRHLAELEDRERMLSSEISQLQRRRHLIEEVLNAYSDHGDVLSSIENYIGTAEWLLNRMGIEKTCPICGSPMNDYTSKIEHLVEVKDALSEEEDDSNRLTLTKELETVRRELSNKLDEREATKNACASVSSEMDELRFYHTEIDKFIGQLKAAFQQYQELRCDAGFKEELEGLRARQEELRLVFNAKSVEARTRDALRVISTMMADCLAQLDVEDRYRAATLDIKNLALKVEDKLGSECYLNQIGSASNWLSYHIALSVALQGYLQKKSPVGVPAFIMFDQPSQVYFPHEIEDSRDKDKKAVRRIIKLLVECALSTDYPYQIILMEHAGEDIWGDLEGIEVVAHWQSDGEKLIPTEWIVEE